MSEIMASRAPISDSFGLVAEADRRFRRICAQIGLPMLAFAIAVPWLHLELAPREVAIKPQPDPLRHIELLPEKPKPKIADVVPPPAAKPVPVAPVKTVTAQAAAPAPAPRPSAREQAQAAGLMQLRDQLAAMNDRNLIAVSSQQALISGARSIRGGNSGDAFAAGAAQTSGGVAGAGHAAVSGGSNVGDVGARRTGLVQSTVGTGSAAATGNGANGALRGGGRGLEEIQLGFDRSKSSFNAIFSRAARETVGMSAGRITVSLTIAPDGSVTRCELVSSGFGNPELEQKILRQVRQMNFGAKNVPAYTYPNYPIDFLPS